MSGVTIFRNHSDLKFVPVLACVVRKDMAITTDLQPTLGDLYLIVLALSAIRRQTRKRMNYQSISSSIPSKIRCYHVKLSSRVISCTGLEPVTLALLARCSNQLS
jgi:hypothetical protein